MEEIERFPPVISQRDNNPVVMVVPYETQLYVKIEAGPPVELHVVSGGVNDKNLVKSI